MPTDDEILAATNARIQERRKELGIKTPSGPQKLRGTLSVVPPVPPPEPDEPAPQRWYDGVSIADYATRLQREQTAKHVAFLRAGVLTEHQGARLGMYAPHVHEAWERGRLGARPGLLIKGPVGTGKTHLAAAICYHTVMEAGRAIYAQTAVFTLARQLLRRIWVTYRDGARETEDDVIKHLTTVDLLVIDDLAHEGRVSEAGIGALHEILSTRLGEHMPTIVTTNLNVGDIALHYDAAISSRLGSLEQITLTGADRRLV